MPSFVDALDTIKTALETSGALHAAIDAPAGKSLQVRLAYRRREEIPMGDLPVCLITRPSVEGQAENNVAGEYQHTVLLYVGFYCEDRDLGARKLIQVDEAVEKALLTDQTLGGSVDFIAPSSSQNDEGKNHPVYFLVKSFVVHKETVYGVE